MLSITELVILTIFIVNCINCTRLPMEIVQVTNSRTNSFETTDHTTDNRYGYHDPRTGRQLSDVIASRSPRILYQVGTSENDLPLCAPNVVCSKIDLYETPWIERQCRCPKQTYNKHYRTIYHAKEIKSNNNFRHVLEEKLKLASEANDDGEYDDYDNENEHIKSLLHKLGVVYNADDILSNENDDIVVASMLHRNGKRKFDDNTNTIQSIPSVSGTKFRHSAHHRDVPRLGGCPSAISDNDGHTITDKTRLYKLCEPVHTLPLCRYFRDYTWTLKSSPEMNVTEQTVHCRCPKNSVSYLIKREPLKTGTTGYTYLFACSPQSRLKCQRKEPCKLFTVRKRQELLDEVNTNALCQCPKNHRCPRLHTDSGVIAGKSYIEDNIRTYSGYCMPDI